MQRKPSRVSCPQSPRHPRPAAAQRRSRQGKSQDKCSPAQKKAKADCEATVIEIANANAADNFILGGNAEDELSGQYGIFGAPEAPAAPSAPVKSPDALCAEVDLQNALADLGDVYGSSARLNMLPEQQQKMLPVLVKLFDAAFRVGYYKFRDAAKFALDKIRAALSNDAADVLTLDQLQGAYVSMGKLNNGNSTRQVVVVEEKAEIENHTAKVDNLFQEQRNVPSPDAGVERNSQRPGTQPAVGNPVPNDAGPVAAGTGEAGGRANRGTGRGQQDGAGVSLGSTVVDRERSDQRIRAGGQPTGLEDSYARTNFR